MALFYGVYLIDLDVAAALDLIRFFAEPDYFRRTHITIRGPYDQRLSSNFESKMQREFSENGRILEVLEVGSFFFGKEKSTQNTVFLKCDLTGSEKFWKKPDFSGMRPHITLYDGNSRQFALTLRGTLKKYSWNFTAKTTSIDVLDKKKDPKEYLQIYFHNAQNICDNLFKGEVLINRFDMKSDFERIYLIDRVAKYLHDNLLKKRYLKNNKL